MVIAMERKKDGLLNLMEECFAQGIITTNQMTKGFGRVKERLDDLSLNIPNSKKKFNLYVMQAAEKGWLVHNGFGCPAPDS
ncbi:hypothetical protein YC2023_072599 [Brassica napus]